MRIVDSTMAFDFERVRDILVCPCCRHTLVMQGAALIDTNRDCRRRFDIIDDIPRLLEDDAGQLSLEEWTSIMHDAGVTVSDD